MPSDPWSDEDCAVLKIVNVMSHSGREPRQTAGQKEQGKRLFVIKSLLNERPRMQPFRISEVY